MARFGVSDAEKYGGQGGGGYFSLKNDKDTARVRILYDSIEDVEGFAVHEVELGNGKKRYVNCLREYGQPMEVCPLCAAKYFTTVKYFVPLYNITDDRIQTWERGKKFGQKLSSMCSRYPHLFTHTFEIERNGQAGDTQTTYEIYEIGQDDSVSLEQFEIPEVLGSHILDKTADDMVCYLNAGYFPGDENSGNSQPVVRRGASNISDRRTPSNTGRREVF